MRLYIKHKEKVENGRVLLKIQKHQSRQQKSPTLQSPNPLNYLFISIKLWSLFPRRLLDSVVEIKRIVTLILGNNILLPDLTEFKAFLKMCRVSSTVNINLSAIPCNYNNNNFSETTLWWFSQGLSFQVLKPVMYFQLRSFNDNISLDIWMTIKLSQIPILHNH